MPKEARAPALQIDDVTANVDAVKVSQSLTVARQRVVVGPMVVKDSGFFRHIFYDTGDGSCLAFFDLHSVGEKEDWDSAVSTGNGLPCG
jgi:hypothetical protein